MPHELSLAQQALPRHLQPYAHQIEKGPAAMTPAPDEPIHVSEERVYGAGAERCEITGRIFENGSGALPREQQTAMFLREAAVARDMPSEGERCPETNIPFEVGSGALTRARQTANFKASLKA